MRILFMTQVLPFPLDAGPKVRAHYVLRYLAEAGHEVHLLSFVRNGESDAVAPLRRLCASVDTVPIVRSRLRDLRDGVRSLATAAPFLVLRDRIAAMQRKVGEKTAARSFDALHADQLWMAPYGLEHAAAGMTVLDQHNAVFVVPQRLANQQRNPVARALLRHEASKLETFERDACRRFDRVVWVTDDDRTAVLGGAGEPGTRDPVIPIAVDPAAQTRIAPTRPFRVTFLGGLHWPPNREGVEWFIARVWPRVAAAVPGALLTVIGKGASFTAGAPRVEITGYVGDPSRYLAETAAFIVPLHSGAGMRVKILDAWCWGLPIVSTTVGAEGLKASHGENLLIADEEHAFAESVISLVRNGRQGRKLADSGRATVEAHYDWRTIYRAWDEIYARPDAGAGAERELAS